MYESFGNRLYNLAGDISPYYTHNRWVRFTLNDEQNGTETSFLDCGTVSSDGCAFGQKITANGGLTLASSQTADFSAGAVKLPTTITNGSATVTLPAATSTIATTSQLTAAGTLTSTAATSDSVTLTWPDGGSRTPGTCSLMPTNASAATNIATSYISAKASNSVTVTHTATAGMTYDVRCGVN